MILHGLILSLSPAALPTLEPPPGPLSAALAPSAPFEWTQVDPTTLLIAVLALLASGLFSTLRLAMAQSSAERVLAKAPDQPSRERLAPLLERIESLSTSAGVLATTCALLFAVLVLEVAAEHEPVAGATVLIALAISAPLLWFVDESLARALAQRSGDEFLVRALPVFAVVQFPLVGLTWSIEAARRGVLRLFGLKDDAESTRRIVAELRDVIEDAEISGVLDETERELIGNVMEFRDVDVAAVMTPRTEIEGSDVEDGLIAAASQCAASGHSRIPIYEDTSDSIIGTVSARDLVQVLAAGKLETTGLREILHPAYFVPETKHISELLAELRRAKIKMAIVVDEYGGTAGLVTVGDIIAEIVGDIPDEYDEDEPSPIRHMPGGAAEVEASLHVTEVNEALKLDIPEESDFETLAGFVLAELGHLPSRGEAFVRGDAEYSVIDANDRRVLKVRVRRLESA